MFGAFPSMPNRTYKVSSGAPARELSTVITSLDEALDVARRLARPDVPADVWLLGAPHVHVAIVPADGPVEWLTEEW